MTILASVSLLGLAGALSAAAITTAKLPGDDAGRRQMIEASYRLAQQLRR